MDESVKTGLAEALKILAERRGRVNSKVIPGGSTVFECAGCRKTVARTVEAGGFWKLRIFLTGRRRFRPSYECEVLGKGRRRYNVAKVYFGSDSGYNLGGKCPQCNIALELDPQEVVIAVGYDGMSDFCEANGLPICFAPADRSRNETHQHYDTWENLVLNIEPDPFSDAPDIPSEKQRVQRG